MAKKKINKKMFQVELEDGSYWQFPAELIAKDRADYYAKKDPDPDYETTYKSEFEYTMSSEDELKDWFQNNMNREDVEEHAVMTYKPAAPRFTDSEIEDCYLASDEEE